jgi:hypothetical protein
MAAIADVAKFLDTVEKAYRRRDCDRLIRVAAHPRN